MYLTGQIEIEIDNMEIYGLIGYPLEHSFSSKFFNLKFQRKGIHAEYPQLRNRGGKRGAPGGAH